MQPEMDKKCPFAIMRTSGAPVPPDGPNCTADCAWYVYGKCTMGVIAEALL
jgi:hypothetical protein